MLYRVVVMPAAQRQVRACVRWWRGERPEAPTLVEDELAEVVASLQRFPERGFTRPGGVRAILMVRSRNLVFYRVRPRAKRVEIVRVRPA